jgi:hypothetical protein
MNIVQQKLEFYQRIIPLVPQQQSKLFRFGWETLSLQRITSLRCNARLSPYRWHTAKTKMDRLCRNAKIPSIFPGLAVSLGVVSESDTIAVDFSDFGNGFQVLMFAKQTQKGRAIPVYFEILRYPIQNDSQNIFIMQAIEHLTDILGFKPLFVFDRGFACPSIIRFLASNDYSFICRVKKGKMFQHRQTGKKFLAKDALKDDVSVSAYDKNLRLVVSDKPQNNNEPWYLITNDTDSAREKIIELYYYRFEIEEFFRDAKRLLGLEHVNFRKTSSLQVALWFVLLTCWFFWNVQESMTENDHKSREMMKLSIIRYCCEQLHKEILHAAQLQFALQYDLPATHEKV